MTAAEKEAIEKYNKLKGEYQEILKRYVELQEQRRQNNLVLNNVEPLQGTRKCWKVVGGVLVEYTLQETVNSLKQNVAMLEQALKALDAQMAKRQKQVLEIELKYNLNPSKSSEQSSGQNIQKTGVLA